jgi:ribosomal protein L11 methyltransferase
VEALRGPSQDSAPTRLIRLAVRCRPELAERALAELVHLVPNGVEEARGDGWVEYAVYGPPGEVPAAGALEVAVGEGLVGVTTTEIPDDWADRWRDFHRPVLVDGRLCVRPSWLDSGGDAAELEVVVDPGQAFGTGAHPTTRMCLELLLELADRDEPKGPLSDLGTGSGVLAIAAARLGWAPVSAFDYEEAALEAASANAELNHVAVELCRANLRDGPPELAPTVVANLTAPLLVAVAGRLTEPPRRLVCSGMLAAEVEQVAGAFAERGLVVDEERSSGDWAALLLRAARVIPDLRGAPDHGRG